jgi:hypothetical protein
MFLIFDCFLLVNAELVHGSFELGVALRLKHTGAVGPEPAEGRRGVLISGWISLAQHTGLRRCRLACD